MKNLLLSLAVGTSLMAGSVAASDDLMNIPLKDIQGKDASLADHKGKVMLVVNVASKCGYTRQYAGLEKIQQKYKDQGFTVLGFPCNDFGSQEPGTNEEIMEFCTSTFNVSFPMYDKLHVKGDGQHPLYAALTGKDAAFPGDIKWNFNKFLIGPDGRVIARYDSRVEPESEELVGAIEAALPKKG